MKSMVFDGNVTKLLLVTKHPEVSSIYINACVNIYSNSIEAFCIFFSSNHSSISPIISSWKLPHFGRGHGFCSV